jgi:hypothetical protein
MKKAVAAIMGILFLGSGLAYSSSLRVESMGGVRDVDNDPTSINPARAALVQKTRVLTGAQAHRFVLAYTF